MKAHGQHSVGVLEKPLLVYESTAQLLAEPDARRYLHSVLLTAFRDKATRVEVRYGEGEAMLYYRVEGRDWELVPPPEDVYPVLKDTLRDVSRLVRPERPDTQIYFGAEGARFEPLEAGWLTYQIGGYWLDMVVCIDPREPFGYIRIDIDGAADFADAAGEALSDYAAALANEDEPHDERGDAEPHDEGGAAEPHDGADMTRSRQKE